MKVCVIGAGGREHALARALQRSAAVVVTPGNPGMTALGITCTAQPPEGVDADLYVVGPEAPLVDGLADRLRARGKPVLGPGADGARLEGSKTWMKEVLVSAAVPTAGFGAFDRIEPAVDFLRSLGPGPYVVKTDGLAAGKGVLVTRSLAEAIEDVEAKLSGTAFGDAGRRVVIEEALVGRELSVMALCDGRRAVPLAAAQDFKRIGEGDSGPNTGGMGAYSPVASAGADVVDRVMDEGIEPTLHALCKRGIDYRGVLYAGVMLTADGPKVLEFNVRFGDPETQVVLPRWEGDVGDALMAAATGMLSAPPRFVDRATVAVILATKGYPQSPQVGDVIEGLDDAGDIDGVELSAAGVSQDDQGRLVTSGGRVVAVTGIGQDVAEARARAYRGVEAIDWPGMTYRRDIAESVEAGGVPSGGAVAGGGSS
jgi:phosphoribosylamine--glycine ligase